MRKNLDHPDYLSIEQLSELGVHIESYIGIDGTLVIGIDTPDLEENELGPLIRIWLNDETVFENPPVPEWEQSCSTK